MGWAIAWQSGSHGNEVLFEVAHCCFSWVASVVVWWNFLVCQVGLVVETVKENMGRFIVTPWVFGSKIVIQEDLVGLLETS